MEIGKVIKKVEVKPEPFSVPVTPQAPIEPGVPERDPAPPPSVEPELVPVP